ncbi:potassium-transporting ATPase subunit KdpC [Bdellovibrio bacteriovorus]|uniref:potassium-transporting ATPase subunit KdpC n=1 Tax=Bdellovibrio bacteriovorus TaxID=959 RepID=UPI0035A6FD68
MKNFIVAVKMFLFMSLLTGILYPLAVTVVGQGLFAKQAAGSLIEKDGVLVGSELIAQRFVSDKYFWPRPSAGDYATVASGASNAAPTSVVLKKAVAERQAHGLSGEMLFASGSGLDPHISPEAAKDQMRRIVAARTLSAEKTALVDRLIQEYTEDRQGGLLGEKRVNVLRLNLALDKNL